jgi:hypothetical protein
MKAVYHEVLSAVINKWKELTIEDEWIFAGFRDKIVNSMAPEEAFRSIDGTFDILLNEDNESVAIEILETIIALIRKSNTAEIPNGVIEKLRFTSNRFTGFGSYLNEKLREVFRLYRIDLNG